MKVKMILCVMIGCFFLMGVGCEKKEKEAEAQNLIVGKWRLVKIYPGFSPEKTYDASDMLCTFNAKGLVEIATTLVPSPFLMNGTYSYSFKSESERIIIINSKTYEYILDAGQLRLIDKAASDGPIFEFSKITTK